MYTTVICIRYAEVQAIGGGAFRLRMAVAAVEKETTASGSRAVTRCGQGRERERAVSARVICGREDFAAWQP